MTSKELRIMGYTCLVMCVLLGLFPNVADADWLSIFFGIAAFGFLARLVYVEYIDRGSGPGPLSPA